MPRDTDSEEAWDEEEEDFESAEEGLEPEEGGEEATVPCPYCRRQIHEDAEHCPYCENYISAEDAPSSRKPLWFVIGLLVCVVIVVSWIMHGL